ncbi:MAG: hypothetical protein KA371_11255 [Acidobacteria bacterium]|nr:hypothetical protein [Acidobacteriota bacterium]
MRALTLVVAFLLVPRVISAQDAFEQRREADLASMTGVDPILLTLAAGKTTYRMGERIPISVEFQPFGMVGLLDTSCGPGIGLDVVLDRSAGTFAPGRERDLSGWETAPPLKPTPVRETVDLNHAVRFDAPGRYRFYVRTRLTVPQSNGTPPRLSNIVTVDIVDRDPTWEASLIARAAVQLDASESSVARSEALADLSFLGTDAAVDLLAPRPDTSVLAVAWSARNRSHAIERMRERLANPSLPVDRVYVA